MVRIAILGAGSQGFTRKLVTDVLAVPELQDTKFAFQDIDNENLRMATEICKAIVKKNKLPAKIQSSKNRKKALEGADYAISVVRVGGLDAFEKDIEIPLRFGVDQCVGDTLGPGGIFYALRTIPVLLDFAKDMREVCPNVLFLNYSNPMAMNTWALQLEGGVDVLGLCHGVQGNVHHLARALGVPAEEMDYVCAGINHQTWFIQVSHKGLDLTHRVLEAVKKDKFLARTHPVVIDICERFGYWSTESNGHLSEYLPWYRKRKKELKHWIDDSSWIHGRTGGYLGECRKDRQAYTQSYEAFQRGEMELPIIDTSRRSQEHASRIIEGLETGRLYRGCFNVVNAGLITNLPDDCIVELPCYVDGNGVTPGFVGDLPLACAALCRASISVQELAVEGALSGNKTLVKQAMMLDPLTSAVCNTQEISELTDAMFMALAPWLPQF